MFVDHIFSHRVHFTQPLSSAASKPESGQPLPPSTQVDQVSLSEKGKALAKTEQIMANYDVRNMDYRERQAMADDLRAAGLINDADWLHITMPPVHFNLVNGQVEPDFGKQVDMIREWENKLEFKKENGSEEKSIRFAEYMIETFKTLESFQSS